MATNPITTSRQYSQRRTAVCSVQLLPASSVPVLEATVGVGSRSVTSARAAAWMPAVFAARSGWKLPQTAPLRAALVTVTA